MVANLQTTVPSQDMLYAVEQIICQRFTFATPANTVIGGLPANAAVIAATVVCDTAFNATTTNTVDLGFTDATAQTPTAIVAAQALSVGVLPITIAATAVPLTRATSVTVRYNQTGTAATAGSALAVVRFVVPR